MIVSAKNVKSLELEVNVELAEEVLDELGYGEMAMIFNDEKILEKRESVWNHKMIGELDENGRKHIKRLYDMVCQWYEANPEDAEAEGYMEM